MEASPGGHWVKPDFRGRAPSGLERSVILASTSWFQTNPAPGRGGESAPPVSVESHPAPQHSGSEAPPASFGGGYQLLILALPLVVLFLMTRSQTKKQQRIESS